jgi:ADP-ribosyltransferase exoenzyme
MLDRQKTMEDMHVYTGIKYSPAKHFKKVGGKLPESTIARLPAFTSTSSSIKSARCFSEDTMHPNDERHGIEYPDSGEVRHDIKIHVPKGSKAASLRDHSFCPAEKEVLLHRGHDIEIHNKPEKLDHNTYLWSAKIVGHKAVGLSKSTE